MGKVFKFLGVVFLILIVGGVAMLIWAKKRGEELQKTFYTAVNSGDVEQVMSLLQPGVRDTVDKQVLIAWMELINSKLGKFQKLSNQDFSTSQKEQNGVKYTESKGTVVFERGTAKSTLVFREDQVVAFSVESDVLPVSWFQGPADTAPYQQRAEAFLRSFLEGKIDAAYDQMHEALQGTMPKDGLQEMIDKVLAGVGALKEIGFHSAHWDAADSGRLKVYHRVKCEKDETIAVVSFQMDEMALHITGFDFTAEAPPASGND